MKTSTIVLLVLLTLVALVVGVFGWQNLNTRVDLVFNAGPIGAWYLAKAFPVPYLMGITFAAGFLIAFLWLGARSMSANRRAKGAERQIAALQDELQWSKRNGSKPGTPAVKTPPAAPKPAPAKVAVAPAGKPSKTGAADPPDFDDLI